MPGGRPPRTPSSSAWTRASIVRMPAQLPPGPREGVRRGLVTCEEQRHGFVADLRVGHARAVLLGREQQRQQVIARTGGPPLRDQRRDQSIEHRDRAIEPPRGRQRQSFGDREPRRELPAELRQDLVQGPGDLAGFGRLHVGGEQGATDDRQGEARHLGVQVQGRAVGPAVGGSLGFSHHGVTVGVDALVVEDRLDQAALSPMGLVLAGEEAVPEHTAGVLQRRALVEVVVAGREDVPDIVRVIDEVDVGARHHRVGQITDRGGTFQQGDRIRVAAAGRPRAWRDRAR